jgi:hypothetical protein
MAMPMQAAMQQQQQQQPVMGMMQPPVHEARLPKREEVHPDLSRVERLLEESTASLKTSAELAGPKQEWGLEVEADEEELDFTKPIVFGDTVVAPDKG